MIFYGTVSLQYTMIVVFPHGKVHKNKNALVRRAKRTEEGKK
jgi:hypothetical protein